MKRFAFLAAALALIISVGAGLSGRFTSDAVAQDESETETAEIATATATTGDLIAEKEFTGNVGYGESWILGAAAEGTVTTERTEGQIINFGEELVRVDNVPIYLVEGEMPMYRELRYRSGGRDAAGRRLGPLNGEDVRQLQHFLLANGYDDNGRLVEDGEFGRGTKRALKKWQEDAGLVPTGKIDSRQMVFSPNPVRVNQAVRSGAKNEGVTVTSAVASVTFNVTSRQRSDAQVGTVVTVDSGSDTNVSGTITEHKRVESDGSTRTEVTVELSEPIPGDAGTVTVTAMKVLAEDAVLVPVTSLLALSEGGWAVEIAEGETTTLTAVELVDASEEIAAVTGIEDGTLVVVPS